MSHPAAAAAAAAAAVTARRSRTRAECGHCGGQRGRGGGGGGGNGKAASIKSTACIQQSHSLHPYHQHSTYPSLKPLFHPATMSFRGGRGGGDRGGRYVPLLLPFPLLSHARLDILPSCHRRRVERPLPILTPVVAEEVFVAVVEVAGALSFPRDPPRALRCDPAPSRHERHSLHLHT